MITHQLFFWSILLLACGYAMWGGRSDERVVAGACLLASLATKFAVSPIQVRYASLETGLLVIDLLLLLVFIWIALRSERFWPLWIAGLQLTNSISHVMKLVDIDLIPKAYGAAAAMWSYPILLILAVGTWRSNHRPADEERYYSLP
ncbi:MAG: hypothetical protein ABIR87_02620 [Sphingomicrobium sp.]